MIERGTRRRRLIVTLIAPLIVWMIALVPLPGVNPETVSAVMRASSQHSLSSVIGGQMSVACLGLGPVFSAFLLVELAALVVPRWRALRRGDPDERRRLRVAACARLKW